MGGRRRRSRMWPVAAALLAVLTAGCDQLLPAPALPPGEPAATPAAPPPDPAGSPPPSPPGAPPAAPAPGVPPAPVPGPPPPAAGPVTPPAPAAPPAPAGAPRERDLFGAGVALAGAPSPAAAVADQWQATRPADAAQLRKIAEQPTAHWMGEWSGDIRAAVDQRVTAAAGALPVLVAYNIVGRDCGSFSAGGAGSAEAYRAWIDGFAAGIGDRAAVVILEPDALALMDCLPAQGQQLRTELLAYAVDTLGSNPATAVYLDAAHSNWHPPAEMARRLQLAGVDGARGFALNVSNFRATPDLVAFGTQVSAALGGPAPAHFVIDTSRNGLGPLPLEQSADGLDWCNPPGRALGARPTADTGTELVDAFLWVKVPGESDGTCRGGPPAGQFFPEYALGLAQRAAY